MFWEIAPATGVCTENLSRWVCCSEEWTHSQSSSAWQQAVGSFSLLFVWSTEGQVQNTAFWVPPRGDSEGERKKSYWCKASSMSAAPWPKRRDLRLFSCSLPLQGLHTPKLWGFWCFNNILCQISFWRASLCLFSFLWAYCSSPWQKLPFVLSGHHSIWSAKKIGRFPGL